MSKDILEADFSNQTDLSHLEQQVLLQYQVLAVKLNTLSNEISKLNKHLPLASQIALDPTAGLADGLLVNMRNLERKIGLVYTLFRTAVYSLLLQNQENRERENKAQKAKETYSKDYGGDLSSELSE